MSRHDDRQPILDFQTARERLLEQATVRVGRQRLPLGDALGRVLAESLFATADTPPAPLSALDGYAIRTADLSTQGETRLPVSQRIAAGGHGGSLVPGTAARIFTGAPLPEGADAIVAQESTRLDGDEVCFDYRPAPWEDVKGVGSDLTRGEPLLEAGRRLRPQDLGLIASAGIGEVEVHTPLTVAVLCTGDELIEPGQPLPPGGTYNANRYLVPAQIQSLGMNVTAVTRVADTLEATIDALQTAAAKADVVMTTGGVSVGEEDHVRAAIESMGALSIWRVNMKPGKPFTFGQIGQEKTPVIGLPGNPVSAFLNFALFARPFLLACQGVADDCRFTARLPAGFESPRGKPRHEFLRARVEDGVAPSVHLYPNQGSSALKSASWANGIVSIPPGTVVRKGDPVDFIPLSSFDLY
ncbi:MAG: gephyrin-like molybdotransferase Glp [Guyparkeria sp.]